MAAHVDAFVDELVRAALDRGAAPEVARRLVTSGIQAAIDRGFRSLSGIRGFVIRRFEFQPDYYERPAVRDWICDLGLTEDERLAAVDARAGELTHPDRT
jgi:hypothetical protein